MYENSFSRNIDNNYFIPQNYRNTYDARFVNAFPNSYYEDINYRQMPVYQMYPYNMEVNNIPEYTNDIEENYMELYPEIYKKLMEIINKIIYDRKIKKVNNGIIELLTLEVYDVFENETINRNNIPVKNTNVNISNTNPIIRNSSNNVISKNNIKAPSNSNINKENFENKNSEKTVEVATRYKNVKNPTLRDLIRILLLNRLWENEYLPRPPKYMTYPDYNSRIFPTSNYNLINNDYTRSYFNSPYPEDN